MIATHGGDFLFQFTPLREGRRVPRPVRLPSTNFNSRPSARGDTNESPQANCMYYFNSRPSARGDLALQHQHNSTLHFNSRPSARGDTSEQLKVYTTNGFQFTPLREGRRLPDSQGGACYVISIHAPPRGATPAAAQPNGPVIFQFTPLREGRHTAQARDGTGSNFNSRPSARGDRSAHPEASPPHNFNSRPSARGDDAVAPVQETLDISIHAPPRGATMLKAEFLRARIISIHAPPRGATRRSLQGGIKTDFNSRPSARGDGHPGHIRRKLHGFQFTPLREGRPERAAATSQGRKFQFTPLREGRRTCSTGAKNFTNFNSRPSARGDTFAVGEKYLRKISIHAPPRGATERAAATSQGRKFQFTPLREGRRC